ELGPRGAVQDFDVRATTDAGAGDDVRNVVAVQVGRGHVDPAGEGRVVGHELAGQLAGGRVIDPDDRLCPGAGAAGDDRVGKNHRFQLFQQRPNASDRARAEAG